MSIQGSSINSPDDRSASRSKPFGIIGGLGPPSTVHYYNALLKVFAERNTAPRLFIAHADMAHALALVAAGDQIGLARYLASFIRALAGAGAEFVAISAVTPHICAPELSEISPLPIEDIIEVLIRELDARGVRRLALLGTKYTMERRLFGRLDGFDLIDLAPDALAEVHRIYTSIAANGGAVPADVAYLRGLCTELHSDGAEAIVAAGTELSLVLHEGEESFPLLDAAAAHVAAVTGRATA